MHWSLWSTFKLTSVIIQHPEKKVSRDEHIFILTGSAISTIARSVISCLVISLLLVPIVALSKVTSLAPRMGIIFVSTAIFVTGLSTLTHARTGEVFAAGATLVNPRHIYLFLPSRKGSKSYPLPSDMSNHQLQIRDCPCGVRCWRWRWIK